MNGLCPDVPRWPRSHSLARCADGCGRLLTIAILVAGLATTSRFVAHADGQHRVCSRYRHRQPQQLHRQRSGGFGRVRHDQSDRPPRRALRVDSSGRVHLRNARRPLLIVYAHRLDSPTTLLIVQDGHCFTTLHGPVTPGAQCSVSDASYVGSELTATCSHWFWPMSGGLDRFGRLTIFYVEMSNELGSGAAPPAHPVAVWVARFNAATFDLRSPSPRAGIGR